MRRKSLEWLLKKIAITGLAMAAAGCATIDPQYIRPPGPYQTGPIEVYLYDEEKVKSICSSSKKAIVQDSCYIPSDKSTIVSKSDVPSLLRAYREYFDDRTHFIGGNITFSIYNVGPLKVIIAESGFIDLVCKFHTRDVDKRKIHRGCYVPLNRIFAINDPKIVLHEIKHYFEGHFH